jgi:hypothetical protein
VTDYRSSVEEERANHGARTCPDDRRMSTQKLLSGALFRHHHRSAQRTRKMLPNGAEHAVRLHELLGFGSRDPADFGGFVTVAAALVPIRSLRNADRGHHG